MPDRNLNIKITATIEAKTQEELENDFEQMSDFCNNVSPYLDNMILTGELIAELIYRENVKVKNLYSICELNFDDFIIDIIKTKFNELKQNGTN